MENFWTTLVPLVIGGSGVVGIISLLVQNSQASRLRRSLSSAQSSLQISGLGRRVESALRTAATLDAYRLTAISLIPWRLAFFDYILMACTPFAVWGGAAGAIALAREWQGLLAPTISITYLSVAVGIAFIAGILTSANRGIQGARRDLVSRLVNGDGVHIVASGKHMELLVPTDGTRRRI